jgi:hypothetical protein
MDNMSGMGAYCVGTFLNVDLLLESLNVTHVLNDRLRTVHFPFRVDLLKVGIPANLVDQLLELQGGFLGWELVYPRYTWSVAYGVPGSLSDHVIISTPLSKSD